MGQKYSRCKRGKRKDIGDIFFRSSWEANYARYLNLLVSRGDIKSWEYEKKTFIFEKIKRGTRAYTPDFKVTYPDGHHEWHEVKGWMDNKSKTRIRRMGLYFSNEPLKVIAESFFRNAENGGLAAIIPNWEYKKSAMM